jgi:hypothetical protein
VVSRERAKKTNKEKEEKKTKKRIKKKKKKKVGRMTLRGAQLNSNKGGRVSFLRVVTGCAQAKREARSKVKVCGRSPVKIVCSNPTGGMDVCLL